MKELLLRALRTFIQAAAGYVTANCVVYLSGGEMSGGAFKNALYALVCAAVASGLCAVMNMRCVKKCDATSDASGDEGAAVPADNVEVPACIGEDEKRESDEKEESDV